MKKISILLTAEEIHQLATASTVVAMRPVINSIVTQWATKEIKKVQETNKVLEFSMKGEEE